MSRVNRATASQSLGVSLTVGAYGLAFGAASISAGFSVLQTCLLSLITFSGASQFALVGVVGAGGTALSAIATAALLGVRNMLYGLRMAPLVKAKGFKRVVAAQVTIDESTGVALSQEKLGEQAITTHLEHQFKVNDISNFCKYQFEIVYVHHFASVLKLFFMFHHFSKFQILFFLA